MTSLCTTCGTPTNDSHTCVACIDLLTGDLRALLGWHDHTGRHTPGLLDDLITTATRQDRIPSTGTTRDLRDERTLDHRYPGTTAITTTPGRLDALTLHREILHTINQIRATIHDVGLGNLRHHPSAETYVRLISSENGYRVRAERLIDRPAPGIRINCPDCGHRITIDPDQPITHCTCGQWGDTDWWVRHVAPTTPTPDTLITARDACAWLLIRHGITTTETAIRQWASRGRLTRHGRDTNGRTLYNPTDLLTLATRTNRSAA